MKTGDIIKNEQYYRAILKEGKGDGDKKKVYVSYCYETLADLKNGFPSGWFRVGDLLKAGYTVYSKL